MEYVRKGFRRVKNRIVNRPSAVQKRDYLKLRAQLDPLRRPSDFGPNRKKIGRHNGRPDPYQSKKLSSSAIPGSVGRSSGSTSSSQS